MSVARTNSKARPTPTRFLKPLFYACLSLSLLPAAASAVAPRDLAHSAFRVEFRRDGADATALELKERFEEACTAGYGPACQRDTWLINDKPSLKLAAKTLSPSCTSGDPVACVVVAWDLMERADTTKDPSRTWRQAALHLKVHCDGGFAPACHDYAWILYNNKGLSADPRAAVNRWKSACKDGVLASCGTLAKLESVGAPAVRKNERNALKSAQTTCKAGHLGSCLLQYELEGSSWPNERKDEFLTKICESGHRDACSTLARDYFDGKRQEPEAGTTLALFGKACELGHARSCFEAGRLYQSNDEKSANRKFKRGCQLGDDASCTQMVHRIIDNKSEETLKSFPVAFEIACEKHQSDAACTVLAKGLIEGVSIPRDASRGRELLFRVCSTIDSDPVACSALAHSFETGDGGERDRTVASKYYRWACVQDDLAACERRGILLSNGDGVRRDDLEALSMFRRACDGGLMNSCFRAGLIMHQGTYVDRDLTQAVLLYSKACDKGIAKACTKLGVVYELGVEGPPNWTDAREAFKAGVELGSVTAHTKLSRLYFKGLGGPKSRGKAKQLAKEACKQGDPKACQGPRFITN